jgi:coproporphyrinogen III oxidase
MKTETIEKWAQNWHRTHKQAVEKTKNNVFKTFLVWQEAKLKSLGYRSLEQ